MTENNVLIWLTEIGLGDGPAVLFLSIILLSYLLEDLAIVTAAGGVWTRRRLHDCNIVASPICPRCNDWPETDLRRYWLCKANKDVPSIHVKNTAPKEEGHCRRGRMARPMV